jgi:GT2 family glycosyltransferase
MSNVRVVIPSLLADTSRLASMCDAATRAGASPVIIANSAHLCRQLTSSAIPHITSRRNDGFAASVVLGAEGDWDWLVILNDDLVFDPDDLTACLSAKHLDAFDPATIVHFDNESARHIPTRLGVLLSVSLLSNVARKAFSRWHASRPDVENSYRSFSAVAIGRRAWDRAGGLDTRYPFTYEDADFVRRARGHGVQVRAIQTSIVHLHSQTGGRFITTVLPVATWSALEYLTKWFGNRTLHRWLLVLALGVRVPLAVLTTSQPRRQIRAIANAARALLIDERPSLPEWESVRGPQWGGGKQMELSGAGDTDGGRQ